ncbi:unnamed protein product, partial [Thlaspi arvense]
EVLSKRRFAFESGQGQILPIGSFSKPSFYSKRRSVLPERAKDHSSNMVRFSRVLLKDAVNVIDNTLSEILVCPLSKQPLRFCEKTKSLVSDAIGVSFPIKDGIPCLVPKDGKILGEEGDASKAQ